MDNLKPMIELTSSKEDWIAIRECYVNSFRHYPLYKYMVPDQSKRDAFLRAYLDANYDVTVGSGEGILLKLTVDDGGRKIGGGLLCVPPSSDGCGWAIGSDEPYWKAYDKHGLSRISPEGLERVKRYEAWENKMIAEKLSATRIPMWNGLFVAMSLEYASKGIGSTVYQETVRIIANYRATKETKTTSKSKTLKSAKTPVNLIERARKQRRYDTRRNSAPEQGHHECMFGRIFRSMSWRQLQQTGRQKTRVSPLIAPEPRKLSTPQNAPVVVAIAHSNRASHFHSANGFQPVAKLPFCDDEGTILFYTHVLTLDPFRTGREANLKHVLSPEANGLSDKNGVLLPTDETPAVYG